MGSSNWSEVPEELLRLIMEKLSCNDLVGFSGVCSHWRSISRPSILLAVSEIPAITLDHKSKSIFNLFHFDHLIRCVQNKVFVTEDYYCVGSSKSMLIFLDRRTSAKPIVLNPITRQTYRFPSLRKLITDNKKRKRPVEKDYDEKDQCTWIFKAIVLWQRNSLVLVVIYGSNYQHLAYCYSCDGTWIALSDDSFFDVVSSDDENKVYALSHSGSVESWDFSRLRQHRRVFVHEPGRSLQIPSRYLHLYQNNKCCEQRYLAVGPGNEYFLVKRIIAQERIVADVLSPYRTIGFVLYKPNPALSTWEAVDHDDDKDSFSAAVFVGASETKVVSPAPAEVFPARGNVYFTDDDWFEIIKRDWFMNYSVNLKHFHGHDVGVYSLKKDELVVGLWQFLDDWNLNYTPFWFMPNPL